MDSCDHIYFSGVFSHDEKHKRADCRLRECMYPAKLCAVKFQMEMNPDKTRHSLTGVR